MNFMFILLGTMVRPGEIHVIKALQQFNMLKVIFESMTGHH